MSWIRAVLRARIPLIPCLSLLGALGLSFLAGAVVVLAKVPPSEFIQKGYAGAVAWYERANPSPDELGQVAGAADGPRPRLGADEPGATCDGFTLFTMQHGTQARLLNMGGNVVHEWQLPFAKAWPNHPHVRYPVPAERIVWFRAHLYPNGDLLAVYHGVGDTPCGYGLAKMDRQSNLLWAAPVPAHHDVDVDDDGTIYALTQDIVRDSPVARKHGLLLPFASDALTILSPDGAVVKSIPLVDAIAGSPFALMLDVPHVHLAQKGDILHANSVRVVRRGLASQFPMLRAGQVLVSLRNLSALVAIDPNTATVVWSAQGIWRQQHCADLLDNGHLLLFDNLGAVSEEQLKEAKLKGRSLAPFHSRVIELDPQTRAMTWFYDGDGRSPFFSPLQGRQQRLVNGNTLIVDSIGSRIFEVTAGKKTVWEYACPALERDDKPPEVITLTGARRYTADELPFLKGVARPRP
jgi:Arylsulfotransferase (ASST)